MMRIILHVHPMDATVTHFFPFKMAALCAMCCAKTKLYLDEAGNVILPKIGYFHLKNSAKLCTK